MSIYIGLRDFMILYGTEIECFDSKNTTVFSQSKLLFSLNLALNVNSS
jgi:hypothetical protein